MLDEPILNLEDNNIAELTKAVGHLTKKNAAREWLLAEIEKTRPNPSEVQAARLDLLLEVVFPDKVQHLLFEYRWQLMYAQIITEIEKQIRQADRAPAPLPEHLGD